MKKEKIIAEKRKQKKSSLNFIKKKFLDKIFAFGFH